MESVSNKTTTRRGRMTYDQAFALNGNVPPQAVEIEAAVLGALMLDEIALNSVIEMLHDEFFYKPEHQAIFHAIRVLVENSVPVDMLSVVEQLRKEGTLEAAGGAYNVAQLTNNITSGAHIEYYAKILSQKYVQRQLILTSTETIKEAYDETVDVMDLLDKTEQKLMDVNDKNFRSDYRELGDLVHSALDQIKAARESTESTSGIPTGFLELDRMTAGMHPGTLIIVAARPAMGKTAFSLSMARNMAVQFGKPVAFFSMEMTGEELAMRLISGESRIESEKLKKGSELLPYEEQLLMERSQILNDAPIYIDDTPGLSIFELRAKCRRLKQKYGIQMVFIDYLQLMNAGGDGKNGNREQEISTISRQLKAMSKELRIPVLAMSQLSRAVETRGGSKKPILSDLRESGAIEQDADIVMFIYRPEYYGIDQDDKGLTHGMADIIIAKHRSGGTGEVRLKFEGKYVRFDNPDLVQADQFATGIPANEQFDSAGGSTITLDSRMNTMGDVEPFSPMQNPLPNDEDAPF